MKHTTNVRKEPWRLAHRFLYICQNGKLYDGDVLRSKKADLAIIKVRENNLIGLISALAPIVGDIVKEAIPDPDKKAEAENKVRLALLENTKQIEASASQIILAEAKSESWIASSWRPILMFNITLIVSVNYLIFPLIEVATGSKLMIPLPDELWTLLTVGVGGYVVGRSGEKVAKTLRKP